MHTSQVVELTDPRLTDISFSPSDPPPDLKGYPLHIWLNEPDLRLRAMKIHECGQFQRKYKDAAGHVWPIVHTCSCKTCLICSEARSQELFEKYMLIPPPPEFLTLLVEAPAAKRVRKALGSLKSPLISQLGQVDGQAKAKMLLLCSPHALSGKLLNRLRTLDYTIQFETHPQENYPFILKKILAPDLPTRFDDRLAIELTKSRRHHFSGMSQADRAKLFAKEEVSNADNSTSGEGVSSGEAPREKVCRCPKCGKPAISHTQLMPIGTPLSQEKWTKPDPPPS